MSNETRSAFHGEWGSRFAFIMAATGAAVGLGNIWKFPYMAGANGGACFVILYMLCLFGLAVPILIAEVLIGKLGRENPVDTLRKIQRQYGAPVPLAWIAKMGIVGLFMILGFYSVIAGWSLGYLYQTATGLFQNATPEHIQLTWEAFIASPSELLIWHSLFMMMTLGVVAKGVNAGIEKASNAMMPLLFLMLLALVAYAAYAGDFEQAVTYLFHPDWSYFNADVFLSALGQALFSVATGAGCMLVYGAYLPAETRLGSTLTIVATLGGLVALLAGLAIFPLVFAYNLPPSAGPDLMFIALPIAFAEMSFGSVVAFVFFVLILFAAWTSSISMAEPLVMLAVEKWGLRRGVAALGVGAISWGIGILALLSFNTLSQVNYLGWGIFDWITGIPTDLFLPLGALSFSLIAGWLIPKTLSERELSLSTCLFAIWRLTVRFLAPIAIVWVLITGFFS